jgi:ParB family chromosome partitioning protein
MTTTSAAEKLAGQVGEKEKVEKRRALGRGLESLLPGPRVVVPRPVPASATPGSSGTPGQDSGGVSGEQIPRSVRNDKSLPTAVADIQAVVEMDMVSRAGAPAPHSDVELRSSGPFDSAQGRQPGAAVPTQTSAAVATQASDFAQDFPHETISIQASVEGRTPSNLVVNIPLDEIDKNPYQTRYDFDPEMLEELADSIRANGVVQPVVVRPGEDGRYILILGERRCRASKLAGKTTVPAIVKRVSTQQAAEMTIIENLQRQDLNCIEQAEAFRVLSKEFNLTQQQIGERVGMSRESVSNYMRLLKLSQPVMEHVLAGRIGFSEARELLKLEDPVRIEQAAERVVKEQMKWEQIETMVARMTGWLDPVPGLPGEERKKSGARWVDPNVRAAQTELERLLQVRVRIKDRKGRGKIVIEYSTVDDYERVVDALRGKK